MVVKDRVTYEALFQTGKGRILNVMKCANNPDSKVERVSNDYVYPPYVFDSGLATFQKCQLKDEVINLVLYVL